MNAIEVRGLVKPPTSESVKRRVEERQFVSSIDMSEDKLAPRVVVGTDFQDFHHARVVGAVTNQFHVRGIRPPEVISERKSNKFDIEHGSYALATLLDNVPQGTVGIWVTDPGVNSTQESPLFREEVVFETSAGNIVVIPNNGLATYTILAQGIERAWKINNSFFLNGHINGSSCQGEDLFAPAAAFAALDPKNIEKFAYPIEIDEIKTFPVEVGQEIDVDAFGQVRYALYLPVGAKAVDIQTSLGEILENVPVQEQGGFADLPDGKLHVYRSSGFKRNGAGLAEATVNQGRAVDIVGKESRIIKIKVENGR